MVHLNKTRVGRVRKRVKLQRENASIQRASNSILLDSPSDHGEDMKSPASPDDISMRSRSSLGDVSMDSSSSEGDISMHSASDIDEMSLDSASGLENDFDSDSSVPESISTPDAVRKLPQPVIQLQRHPNGTSGPCRMIVDCIMPGGDIRVSEPGAMLVTSKAYIVPGNQYPLQRIAILESGNQEMPKRAAVHLADTKLFDLKIKNVAVSYDASVSVLAALPGENFWSLWLQKDLTAAFGKSDTNWVLNVHRNIAGQSQLPTKASKRKSIAKGSTETPEQRRYFESLMSQPPVDLY